MHAKMFLLFTWYLSYMNTRFKASHAPFRGKKRRYWLMFTTTVWPWNYGRQAHNAQARFTTYVSRIIRILMRIGCWSVDCAVSSNARSGRWLSSPCPSRLTGRRIFVRPQAISPYIHLWKSRAHEALPILNNVHHNRLVMGHYYSAVDALKHFHLQVLRFRTINSKTTGSNEILWN